MTIYEQNVAEAAAVLARLTSPEVADAVRDLSEAVWEAAEAAHASRLIDDY